MCCPISSSFPAWFYSVRMVLCYSICSRWRSLNLCVLFALLGSSCSINSIWFHSVLCVSMWFNFVLFALFVLFVLFVLCSIGPVCPISSICRNCSIWFYLSYSRLCGSIWFCLPLMDSIGPIRSTWSIWSMWPHLVLLVLFALFALCVLFVLCVMLALCVLCVPFALIAHFGSIHSDVV